MKSSQNQRGKSCVCLATELGLLLKRYGEHKNCVNQRCVQGNTFLKNVDSNGDRN